MYLNEERWKVKKFSNPFPFAEVDEFLKPEVYVSLKEIFPALNEEKKNNVIVKREFTHIADDDPWKKVGAYFVGREFFERMVHFYGDDIKRHYPELSKKLSSGQYRLGISGQDSFDTCDILLDFHIGINTPVSVVSSSRGPHLDNRKVLYVGLCYFKDEDDLTSSGHYTAYELIKGPVKLGTSRSVSNDQVRPFAEVKYGANRLATFLNTPYSVHGVSPREVTDKERRFFVFNAVMKEDLYRIKPSLWQRIRRKIFGADP